MTEKDLLLLNEVFQELSYASSQSNNKILNCLLLFLATFKQNVNFKNE